MRVKNTYIFLGGRGLCPLLGGTIASVQNVSKWDNANNIQAKQIALLLFISILLLEGNCQEESDHTGLL